MRVDFRIGLADDGSYDEINVNARRCFRIIRRGPCTPIPDVAWADDATMRFGVVARDPFGEPLKRKGRLVPARDRADGILIIRDDDPVDAELEAWAGEMDM